MQADDKVLGIRSVERAVAVLDEVDELNGGRYFLGLHLVALGAAASNRFRVAERAQPRLRRLAARTSDTIYITRRVGDEAMGVAREEGTFPIKTLCRRRSAALR